MVEAVSIKITSVCAHFPPPDIILLFKTTITNLARQSAKKIHTKYYNKLCISKLLQENSLNAKFSKTYTSLAIWDILIVPYEISHSKQNSEIPGVTSMKETIERRKFQGLKHVTPLNSRTPFLRFTAQRTTFKTLWYWVHIKIPSMPLISRTAHSPLDYQLV